jgi:hypothetical protein
MAVAGELSRRPRRARRLEIDHDHLLALGRQSVAHRGSDRTHTAGDDGHLAVAHLRTFGIDIANPPGSALPSED